MFGPLVLGVLTRYGILLASFIQDLEDDEKIFLMIKRFKRYSICMKRLAKPTIYGTCERDLGLQA